MIRKSRQMPMFALLVGAICLVLPLVAHGQAGRPCSETVRKYCSDVVPGGGRIMKCLSEHQDEQSIACKDWIESQQKSMKELTGSCTEEIAQLCNITPPDSIRIFFCLNDNYMGLKLPCREKLREIKERLQ